MSQLMSGFQKISRHDNLFKERIHDAYKMGGKLHEPSICPQCGAVFHDGHWQWRPAPVGAHNEICPACHRINDQFPAGFLNIKGAFFLAHRDEIMHLLHNHAERERAEHPLNRIMTVEELPDETRMTTTDIHLARGMGDALHHAYQGELEYHYSPEQSLLRVSWER